MADLTRLVEHLGGLLLKVEPKERRRLSTKIGQKLRKRQQQRIMKQENPDGSKYVPRKKKNNLRAKQGRIKNKMFLKIKNIKYLQLQNEPDRIAIGFAGRVANIARVHQYGLRDRPDAKTPEVRYAQRELLGFTGEEIDLIEYEILQHLQSGL